MKKIFPILIFIGALQHANSQSWQWTRQMGSINDDTGSDICIDNSANIYMVGNFSLPSGVFGNDTFSTHGILDIFIVKLNSSGNIIWAKRAGGSDPSNNWEGANSIIYESSTNSIVVSGTMDGIDENIDSCQLGGGEIIFISKLDLTGKCIWANRAALLGNASNISLVTTNNGSIYMAGYTRYLSYFDGTPIQPGGFLAKFQSSDGSLVWVKKVLNLGGYWGNLILNNNELLIGGASGIDSLNLDTSFISCNKRDVFIAKFDTLGNLLWAKTMGGPNNDEGGAIGLDADGSLYVTGVFKDTAYFDGIMLTNANKKDWFLAKYNSVGNISWVEHLNASGLIYDGYIRTNSRGESYAIGTFSDSATFGNFSITASSANDIFLTRYDSSGMCLGVCQVGNSYHGGIIADNNGSVYITGTFSDTASFDGNSLISYGASDAFIAKHDAISGDPEQRKANNTLTIYANPTAGKCNITVPDDFAHEKNLTLSIYDNTGKLIQQKTLEMNEGKIKLNLEAEAKGIYNVTLSNGKKSYGGKIIFE